MNKIAVKRHERAARYFWLEMFYNLKKNKKTKKQTKLFKEITASSAVRLALGFPLITALSGWHCDGTLTNFRRDEAALLEC